jgi:hypothetical protein
VRSNPVYRWTTEEYRSFVKEFLLEDPADYMSVGDDVHAPPLVTEYRAKDVGSLDAEGVRRLAEWTGWPDGQAIEEMARDGIDLMCQLPDGARPRQGVALCRYEGEEQRKFIKEFVKNGMTKRHLRKAIKGEKVTVHPFFLVPKSKPGQWRDIINFKYPLDLSRWGIENKSFNEATPLEYRPSVTPGSILEVFRILEYARVKMGINTKEIRIGNLDVSEAYKHISIAEGVRKQQGFDIDGQKYVSIRMQFGTAASASIWCRVMNLVLAACRRAKIGSVAYFDDMIVISVSKRQSARAMVAVRQILRCMGLKLNEDKSDSHGRREAQFVGVEIDLDRWQARILEKTIKKIKARIEELRILIAGQNTVKEDEEVEDLEIQEKEEREAEQRFNTEAAEEPSGEGSVAKVAQKLAGGLNFVSGIALALKPVRAHIYWVARCRTVRNVALTRHYLDMIEAMVETHNWMDIRYLPYEEERQHNMRLGSDSSDGWVGGVGYDDAGNLVYIQEKWEDIGDGMSGLHINDKELLGHIMTTQMIGGVVGKEYYALPTVVDNTATESWVNKLFAKVKDCGADGFDRRQKWIRDYACWQQARQKRVTAKYIHTSVNVLPDALSRPETHQHVFDVHVQILSREGKECRRIRVPRGWRPETG